MKTFYAALFVTGALFTVPSFAGQVDRRDRGL